MLNRLGVRAFLILCNLVKKVKANPMKITSDYRGVREN
jgi:hypothetical protein